MREAFVPTRYSVAALVVAGGALFVAYAVVPHRLVRYGAWLVAFTVWMVWFVYAGVDYVYGLDSENGE